MPIYSVKVGLRLVSVRAESDTLLEIRVLGDTSLVCARADASLNNLNRGLIIPVKHVEHLKKF